MLVNMFAYKQGSAGAKALAEALNIKSIRHQGSKYRGNKDKVVINWGSSTMTEETNKSIVINRPEAVAIASDKLKFFDMIRNFNHKDRGGRYVDIPPYTRDRDDTVGWILDGEKVVCRTILNGHSGEGIIIAETPEQLVAAPLYVMYMPKKQEYRFHVFMGKVVDIQRKARDREMPDEKVNWQVRNHDNGFVYVRNEEALGEVPLNLHGQALWAVEACGLDFGAVDIIYNERMKRGYVLEVNTAPGLSGETLEGYRKRFDELTKGDELFKEYLEQVKNGAWFDVVVPAKAAPRVPKRPMKMDFNAVNFINKEINHDEVN